MKIDKVVAVQNWGTSGTTLIQSLLDNHPQILSLPWLHAANLYRIWEEIIAEGGNVNDEKIANKIKISLPILFDANLGTDYGGDKSLAQMGENQNEKVEVKEEIFFAHLKEILATFSEITRDKFLIAVFISYNLCYNRDLSEASIICFPIHSQEKKYAGYLLEDFKQVYFLHMVREPVQNMGSLIKHINQNQMIRSLFKSLIHCSVSQIIQEKEGHWISGYRDCHGKKSYFNDLITEEKSVYSRAVRLEDLHNNSKEVLEKICNWIDIDWNESLTKSTFMGKLWHNRVESVRVQGFDKKVISQKHSLYMNDFDKYRLKLLSKTEQEYFGYYRFNILDHICFVIFLPILLLIPFKADFNKNRFKFRLKAISKLYSAGNWETVKEWIIKDEPIGLIVGGTIANSEKLIDLSLANKAKYCFRLLPYFIFRIFINYYNLRKLMLSIWFKRLTKNDSDSYIKVL